MTEVTARANVLLEEAAKEAKGEITATLRNLGLSSQAANVLFALARTSAATAGDLIAATRIPDSKIYYALRELADIGLVEVQGGKPRMYRMVSPMEAETHLEHLLQAKHERDRASVRRMASLLEPLRAGSSSPAMDIAYVVKGTANVLARAESMVRSARESVLLLTSEESVLKALETELSKAARRGTKVLLAVPDVEIDRDLERQAEVRSIVCSCVVLVVDSQQILTVSEGPGGAMYAITSTDETLVRLGLDYWQSPRCCVD